MGTAAHRSMAYARFIPQTNGLLTPIREVPKVWRVDRPNLDNDEGAPPCREGHPYTFVWPVTRPIAVWSGYTFPSASPIVGDPYDQSGLGNGGKFNGEGGPRRGAPGPAAAVPFQSCL
jgi:hypothetical protein